MRNSHNNFEYIVLYNYHTVWYALERLYMNNNSGWFRSEQEKARREGERQNQRNQSQSSSPSTYRSGRPMADETPRLNPALIKTEELDVPFECS